MQKQRANNKVLVVDDDKNILQVIKCGLEKTDYRVFTAENGKAGLNAINRHHPDIALLDVEMPGMSGLELCKQIKADNANRYMPIILVTGKVDIDDRVEGLTAGADDYVCKPFALEELCSRLEAHLRNRRLFEQLADDVKNIATVEGVQRTIKTMAHYINNANQSILGMAQLSAKYPSQADYNQKLSSVCLKQIPKVTAVMKAMETLVMDPNLPVSRYDTSAKDTIWDIEDKINSMIQ